eukprot:TRINITY_DN5898_c1_g1_i1.p1 TRINITY_DN5898_c1_g1~~TRINITY_DN5898_c1_g1_i1.p1  ORF type:complete len:918 (-),score=256.00 TRINITY_DN5898_c1_g1_i1:122-2875(-)
MENPNFIDEPPVKRIRVDDAGRTKPFIRVGSGFQAEIPELESESSTELLGSKIWSPDTANDETVDIDTLSKSLKLILSRDYGLYVLLDDHHDLLLECIHSTFESENSINEMEIVAMFLEKALDLVPSHYTWTDEEIFQFELGMSRHGRQFHEIQKFVPTRTVKDIIRFYYRYWKVSPQYKSWKRKTLIGRPVVKFFSGKGFCEGVVTELMPGELTINKEHELKNNHKRRYSGDTTQFNAIRRQFAKLNEKCLKEEEEFISSNNEDSTFFGDQSTLSSISPPRSPSENFDKKNRKKRRLTNSWSITPPASAQAKLQSISPPSSPIEVIGPPIIPPASAKALPKKVYRSGHTSYYNCNAGFFSNSTPMAPSISLTTPVIASTKNTSSTHSDNSIKDDKLYDDDDYDNILDDSIGMYNGNEELNEYDDDVSEGDEEDHYKVRFEGKNDVILSEGELRVEWQRSPVQDDALICHSPQLHPLEFFGRDDSIGMYNGNEELNEYDDDVSEGDEEDHYKVRFEGKNDVILSEGELRVEWQRSPVQDDALICHSPQLHPLEFFGRDDSSGTSDVGDDYDDEDVYDELNQQPHDVGPDVYSPVFNTPIEPSHSPSSHHSNDHGFPSFLSTHTPPSSSTHSNNNNFPSGRNNTMASNFPISNNDPILPNSLTSHMPLLYPCLSPMSLSLQHQQYQQQQHRQQEQQRQQDNDQRQQQQNLSVYPFNVQNTTFPTSNFDPIPGSSSSTPCLTIDTSRPSVRNSIDQQQPQQQFNKFIRAPPTSTNNYSNRSSSTTGAKRPVGYSDPSGTLPGTPNQTSTSTTDNNIFNSNSNSNSGNHNNNNAMFNVGFAPFSTNFPSPDLNTMGLNLFGSNASDWNSPLSSSLKITPIDLSTTSNNDLSSVPSQDPSDTLNLSPRSSRRHHVARFPFV